MMSPPIEAAVSTAAAKAPGTPKRIISGIVKLPVTAALADPLPLTMGQICRVSRQLISYTHLFSQHICSIPDIAAQLERSGNPIRMQDIILYVQIIQQTEILENETDIGDAEITPILVGSTADINIVNADLSPAGNEDTGHQVEQGCFS
jgi:hypothetical protein